ncbi:hypothetical protein M436DRAFT_68311 [Aureobasidium namibiae CBS 147.97]|uniref:Amino acid permease/ SLC12A domain-containing protein n=1 Tax=Aureobasidium namibiae CBS 147.97 TaxID=1043004 RepID=A0A074W540_9PEZI|nr:uncharacterized protein M436DRAFT_68311 [Aureobasidium namibiae CBS 147.97]KEQ68245.1 hypothetical protein M436DRAFT_68311 [Aureobasidium namibiae CBS 147.97]
MESICRSVFTYGLENGGPAGLLYGFIFCFIGYLAVVLSLAELVSMMPNAAGQYYWVGALTPPRYGKFLSWIIGGYLPGTSVFVGLMTSVFAFLGADGVIHMCKEVEDLEVEVPRSLVAFARDDGLPSSLYLKEMIEPSF